MGTALEERRTPKPVAEPASMSIGPFHRLIGLLGRWELGSLTDNDRQRIIRGLFHEGHRFRRFTRRFAALMTLSVLIAVMGLLADSTAVVIGAMLVAPLMSPVLGAAAALVMGWPGRVARQLAISFAGAAGAIGLAAVTSLVFPSNVDPLPGEVLARTSPNLLDLGIALAAGAAGAYAQIRRAAADALTGVAVAVALVPPLAVVGICLQLQLFNLALGAFLLFLANVTGIVMSASMTFLVCGLVPGRRLQAGSGLIAGGIRWAALAVIVMILPLHVTRTRVFPPTDPTEDVELSVDRFIGDASWGAEVISVSVERASRALAVDIVLTESGSVPHADEVAGFLANELSEAVSVTIQVVQVRTDSAVADEGPVDEGPVDEGTGDEGPVDEGTGDEGPVDEGTGDDGPVDEGTGDDGPVDEGPVDEGPVGEGTGDEGTGSGGGATGAESVNPTPDETG